MNTKLLLIVALTCVAVPAFAGKHTRWFELKEKNYDFDQYVREYRKPYVVGTPEYEMRRDIFERRLKEIHDHNAQDKSWKAGVNHMTDHTTEELSSMRGYKKSYGYASRGSGVEGARTMLKSTTTPLSTLPTSIDWRNQGAVSPVKDQGRCGSCWTFASAETIESHWYLATGHMQALSEQQIASCTSNPKHCGGHGGCTGGTAEVAFASIITTGGLASEWTYPYRSYQGQNFACGYNKTTTPPQAKISSYDKIATNSYADLMTAVATRGPVAISVDASVWHNYESGVFDGCNQTNPDLDHAVQLVGYGTDAAAGGDYWIVRNSWSPSFGEDGYIRIARKPTRACGTDVTPQDGSGCDGGPTQITVCGTCGILYDNVVPVVSP